MTGTNLDTTAIHDFRARNGWYATMTRHGRNRQPQYEARIHDPQGREVLRMWVYTNLKDAKLTVEEKVQQFYRLWRNDERENQDAEGPSRRCKAPNIPRETPNPTEDDQEQSPSDLSI